MRKSCFYYNEGVDEGKNEDAEKSALEIKNFFISCLIEQTVLMHFVVRV